LVARAEVDLILDPVSIDHPGSPELWPVMSDDQVQQVVRGELRVFAGAPTTWCGEDREVLVVTDDQAVAARAADELACRDAGVGYLTVAKTGVAVVGPLRAVLVGWARSDHIDWLSADPEDSYGLQVCVVRPARPARPAVAGGIPLVEIAAEAVTVEVDLAVELAAEDASEDAGELQADDRRTCHTCRTWATPTHLANAEHQRALEQAANRLVNSGGEPR
jgi:hypothetical protein